MVWRDSNMGASIGYAREGGFAIVMDNPLYNKKQYRGIISSFLYHIIQEYNLDLIWILALAEIEEILGNDLRWRTFSYIAEERVNLDNSGEKGREKKER